MAVLGVLLCDVQSYWTSAGEEPLREGLVDDAHRPPTGPILLGDLAAQEHRDTKGRKIARTHRVIARSGVAAPRRRVSLHGDLIAVVGPTEEAVVRIRGDANTRQGADARQQSLERGRLAYGVVRGGFRIHANRHHAFSRIPEVHTLQVE